MLEIEKIKELIEKYKWLAEEFAELAFDYEYEDDSEVNRDKSVLSYSTDFLTTKER